jgi:hypothetical protein
MLHSLRDIKKTNLKKYGGIGETLLRQNFSLPRRTQPVLLHAAAMTASSLARSMLLLRARLLYSGSMSSTSGRTFFSTMTKPSSTLTTHALHRTDAWDWERRNALCLLQGCKQARYPFLFPSRTFASRRPAPLFGHNSICWPSGSFPDMHVSDPVFNSLGRRKATFCSDSRC